jgi:glycosyltransferase involved in cell wall biosynthesis
MNNEFNLYPLITIIIPSYNHEKYIAQAIRSVFNQTYSCIELIIIDDGSSDGSSKIIEDEIKFFQSSGRKVLYKKNANQGLSKTLNEAINLASGEYICFLASDDAYLPDKLKCSFNLLNGTKSVVGAIYTDGYIVNEKGLSNKNYSNIKKSSFYKVFELIPPAKFEKYKTRVGSVISNKELTSEEPEEYKFNFMMNRLKDMLFSAKMILFQDYHYNINYFIEDYYINFIKNYYRFFNCLLKE